MKLICSLTLLEHILPYIYPLWYTGTVVIQSNQRDSSGRFLPGNSGGGLQDPPGGRPKSKQTLLKEFEHDYPNTYYELMAKLREQGLQGDADAAKYVIDRLKGKPKQSIDANITAQVIGLTLQDYTLLQAMNRKEEIELTGKGTILLDAPEQPTEPLIDASIDKEGDKPGDTEPSLS